MMPLRLNPSVALADQRSPRPAVCRGRNHGLPFLAAVVVFLSASSSALAQADINNGIVRLGVNKGGGIGNVNPTVPPLVSAGGTVTLGMRYMPTNNEADWAVPQEGWGVGDVTSGNFGGDIGGGFTNLVLGAFASTASTATATVTAGGIFQVTHNYQPSANPNAYQVTATIKNISAAPVVGRYRRTWEMDIEPTPLNQYQTINGVGTPGILDFTNGMSAVSPLVAAAGVNANVVNQGPGVGLFTIDFDLGTLAPGASTTILLYYGAAGTRTAAMTAITALGLTVYYIGEPTTVSAASGAPNSFFVGGFPAGSGPVTPPSPTPAAPVGGVGEGSFAGTDPTNDPLNGSEGSFGFGAHLAAEVGQPSRPTLVGPFLNSAGNSFTLAAPGFANAPAPGTSLQVFNLTSQATTTASIQEAMLKAPPGSLGWIILTGLAVVGTVILVTALSSKGPATT